MGLDQYVYRVRKPKLEKRMYKSSELRNMEDAHWIFVDDISDQHDLIEQLLPYTVTRDVESQFIDGEQIFKDYGFPDDAYICFSCSTEVVWTFKDAIGNNVKLTMSRDEIEKKYTITKARPCYIWYGEEVEYWRKNYDLQDWIYDCLDDVQNLGYYILDADIIRDINEVFNEHLPKEDPDGESALFYHEWY